MEGIKFEPLNAPSKKSPKCTVCVSYSVKESVITTTLVTGITHHLSLLIGKVS